MFAAFSRKGARLQLCGNMDKHSDCSNSSSDPEVAVETNTRKRTKTGRTRDVIKGLRANCLCKRLRCFQTVSKIERKRILREFNELENSNGQNTYLSGLITVLPVLRRRPRKNEAEARPNSASFAF